MSLAPAPVLREGHRQRLADLARPPEIDEADVVAATLVNGGRPPPRLGITHWSSRFLAAGAEHLVRVSGADLAEVEDRSGLMAGARRCL